MTPREQLLISALTRLLHTVEPNPDQRWAPGSEVEEARTAIALYDAARQEPAPAQAVTTVDVNSGMDALPANGPASDSDRAVYQSIADRYWRDAQAGTEKTK